VSRHPWCFHVCTLGPNHLDLAGTRPRHYKWCDECHHPVMSLLRPRALSGSSLMLPSWAFIYEDNTSTY
jgi:hypothetical protein